jgi:hypothetical protein
MNPTDYPIHPMANQLPMMNEREFEALKKSIARDGLQVPILLSMKGHVIDGRNRLKACHETGIEPRFINLNDYLKEYQDYVFKFDIYNHENTTGLAVALDKNEEAIIPELIKILNINRRHLTEFEKYERLGAFNAFVEHGTNRHEVKSGWESRWADSGHLETEEPSQDEPPSEPEPAPVAKPVVTNEQAAKELGISTGKLKQIKHIDKHADPEIKEQLRSDKISVNAAYEKVREKTQPKPEPPPQQQEPPQQPEVEQEAVSPYAEKKQEVDDLLDAPIKSISRISNKMKDINDLLYQIPYDEFMPYNPEAVVDHFYSFYKELERFAEYFKINIKEYGNKKK